MKQNKKKIWIAGHTGLIGKSLLKLISNSGDYQIITEIRKNLDLTNTSQVDHFISKKKPDCIFISAGKVGGIEYNSLNPFDFLYENSLINFNILKGSFNYNINKVIVFGSSCMYPKNINRAMKESDIMKGELESTNMGYSIAKIFSTKLAEFYGKKFKKNYISVIPAATYGVNDSFDSSKNHVIPALIKKFHEALIRKKKSVEIWGSGNAKREFIYVDDLSQALILIMKKYNSSEPINIGSGEEISIKELAFKIKKVVGFKGYVRFNKKKLEGVKRKLLDNRRVRKLGWKPGINLDAGILKVYNQYLKIYETQ